ncbi:MAG TPA: alkaline phosphatase [Brevibacterium sp.]|nr:alkaline phosphatase [Brevibacterium sp.]
MQSRSKKMFVSVALAALMIVGSVMPAVAAPKLTGNGKTVKNVIVLVSDGMGYNQVLAADYYSTGKAGTSVYAKFPTNIAMSTWSFGSDSKHDNALSIYDPNWYGDFDWAKKRPTDSAAAGTAMSTGTKTYDAAIGVDEDKFDLRHLSEDFEALGRATGVVSSVQFSHATPASFVAHEASRNNYSAIANKMIFDSNADVIIGAGNPGFNDNGQPINGSTRYVGGDETWAKLQTGSVMGADANGDGVADAWTVIQEKAEFEALTTGEAPDRLIGIPQVGSTLQQGRGGDRNADPYAVPLNDNVPTLKTMTEVALNVLDNNDEGFFLMVEGGAIDWAGHANQSGRVIEEQIDFNDSVEAVCDWVQKNSNWGETLVIVTGDHETGYLTGTAGVFDDVMNNGKGNLPTMAWNSGDHTNQLIPFYAKGAGAEIFKKLADQKDPVRGDYLDNIEISVAIRALIANN